MILTTLLHILFTGPQSSKAALILLALCSLSWLFGLPLRRSSEQGTAFGFMVMAGSANLALFLSRAFDVSTSWFGPATLVIALAHSFALRVILTGEASQKTAESQKLTPLAGITLAGLLLALWGLRVVQIDPSSSLSSHLGWIPLYAAEVFQSGRFPRPDELAAGDGILESVSYVADLQGLVLLVGWAGITNYAAAYVAASALAMMLALVVLTTALRQQAAVILFLAMVVALAALDPFFRTAIGRQWGDTFLLLGGSLIVVVLTGPDTVRSRALTAAAAGGFLVFSRHYSALYWAVLMVVGWLVVSIRQRQLDIWPWIGLTALFLVDAAREIGCLLSPPSPWYPGSRQVAEVPTDSAYWISGILHDLGFLQEYRLIPLVMMVRLAWLAAITAAAVLSWRRRQAPWWWLLPLGVFALPLFMQAVTGYRTSGAVNKLMIFVVWLPAWLPALVIDREFSGLRTFLPSRHHVIAGMTVLFLMVLALSQFLGRWAAIGQNIYRAHIAEIGIDHDLRQSLGENFSSQVTSRPLIYFYYEPGLALRYYIGGRIFSDLDWYGNTVRTIMPLATDMGDLVRRLECPNLWIGAPFTYTGFDFQDDQRLRTGLTFDQPPPWVALDIQQGRSRFILTRPEWCNAK